MGLSCAAMAKRGLRLSVHEMETSVLHPDKINDGTVGGYIYVVILMVARCPQKVFIKGALEHSYLSLVTFSNSSHRQPMRIGRG